MNRSLHKSSALIVPALFVALLAGCGDDSPAPDTQTAPADRLQTKTERGPVSVVVEVVPEEPQLSDEPVLTLTVTADDKVTVDMPPFGESLGDFIIRDFYEPPPKSADGKQIRQQVYTLEPTIAGKSAIAPMTVNFVDERPNGDGKDHQIETDPLIINVATIIESEAPSLNDLRPAAGPVELPSSRASGLTWLFVAILIGVVVVIAVVFAQRRWKKKSDEPQLTPQQLAWRELNDLIGSGLHDTDIKEYFVQLTGVVRRYIERSTGVRAPEQTTEEFLREVSQQSLFSGENDERLGAFLESADLVKFAGYQPDPESIKQSTHRARQFIELKARIADTNSVADGQRHSQTPEEVLP